jgi:outer membrane receptor protein involved in Fe transport
MQRKIVLIALVALGMALFAPPAFGQATTAGIRGKVADNTGPIPQAQVLAVNTQSGFQYTAATEMDGTFVLSGLVPGTYDVKVSSEAYTEKSLRVQVLLGQDATVNVTLTPTEMFVGDVTVVGETTKLLIDTRTPTITTNITTQQIDDLPQGNRNFLSFAALAPGVGFTLDADAAGQEFRSGASNPKQVNVFIDGLSYKNDIIKGGAFMQDSSRGNPFPQNAVQEYQVLTQNYKAEYEKSAAAVITAITKSGGNDFHGDLFWFYQDEGMIELDDFAKARGDEKAPLERNQYGLALGGPIIKDTLHFFLSYEQNTRDVFTSVFRGSAWDQAPDNVIDRLDDYETGTLTMPLDSKLYFGKLSWQPTQSQTMEFSFNKRDESETRGYGGQRVEEGAENFEVGTDALVLKHQIVFGNSFNEANLTYQKMSWFSGAGDQSLPHENYTQLLDIGPKDYNQDLQQEKFGLRDDMTFFFEGMGSHTLKAGLVANWMDYSFCKAAYYVPYFEYRGGGTDDENWQYPYKALYGFGDPQLDFGNTQFGIFVQDDWKLSSNFTVSLGVRWDYETNMLNNDWVTPPAVAEGLRTACKTYGQPVGGQSEWCINELFDVENYISDGSNRESYKGMIQPRVGFTWDPAGNGQTVVYGGWGLYYDRVTLNDIYDEEYRHVWGQYTFCFSDDGTQPAGCSVPAIPWDPAYLEPGALDGLIASGSVPGPELFLLGNDTKPPKTIQWTVGLRQQFGSWLGSLSYANVEGSNGLVWSFGTLPPGTNFNDRWGAWIPVPGYGFIMRGYDVRKTEYDGVFLTFDKPYTSDSKWGANFAYSYGKGYQNASLDEGTAFAFDYLPPDFPMFPSNNDERHRFIASGTVGLPLGFRVASIITLGSGTPFSYTDCLAGWDKCVWYPNGGRPPKQSFLGIEEFAYRSVDLRLEWEARFGGDFHVGVVGEAFNVFDYDNDGCFDGWAGAPGEPNPRFGQPNCQFNTRRFQVGVKLGF